VRWLPLVTLLGCGRVGFAHVDPAVDGSTGDGELDAVASACGGTGGPAQVAVDLLGKQYCIDATEVTRAQYAVFYADSNRPTIARCAWNTDYTATMWPATVMTQDYPVVGVDWCDAATFCAWAGKRLCGAIGGGTLVSAEAATTGSVYFVRRVATDEVHPSTLRFDRRGSFYTAVRAVHR